MLIDQINKKQAIVENQYTRTVKPEGNKTAQAILSEVFQPCDSAWRGIGSIPASGLEIVEKYRRFDALKNFEINLPPEKKTAGCLCGDIMRGAKAPTDCSLFAKVCTPLDPKGACMVSSEGACAAYYKYR